MGIHSVPVDQQALTDAVKHLRHMRVAVFIVAYNAERFIESVLKRIPEEIRPLLAEIFIIDDSSKDQTSHTAIAAGAKLGLTNLSVLKTPFNRRYGGNQKLGYLYAIEKNFDVVILLHGDGQYPPEHVPQVINAFADNAVDAVFASRMIDKMSALRGKMPLYKWVGNQILTHLENALLGASLSEFHTGYRAYRVRKLKSIPFEYNSNDFHFDTEIIIQLIATQSIIREIPIPTHYGDEVCHVDGFRYATNCIRAIARFRLTQIGLFYEPNYDFGLFEEDAYYLKTAPNSLHQHILSRKWNRSETLLQIGAKRGLLAAALAEQIDQVTTSDKEPVERPGKAASVLFDLNVSNVSEFNKPFDNVLLLDEVQSLSNPEEGLKKVFDILKPHGLLFVSTGNVTYFPVRVSFLFGQFNYGKRGILDQGHKRLFTISSLKTTLENQGFIVKEYRYFGPPIADLISNKGIWEYIDRLSGWLAKIWPSLFAYSFLVIAERMDELEDIYARTLGSKQSLLEEKREAI